MKSFTAQLQDFKDLTEQNLKYIAVNAISDVVEAAQTPQLGISKGATGFVEGKIPVAESELINSLTSEGVMGPDSYTVALAGFDIGDYTRFEWTAPQAMPMEVGYTTKTGRVVGGRHYVGKNAARFSEFVMKYAAMVRR